MPLPILLAPTSEPPGPPPPPPPIPQPPAPPAYVSRLAVSCHARRGGLLAAMTAAFDRQWTDLINQTGTGGAGLGADDADCALVALRSILRFSIDGNPAFSSVVEEKTTTEVDPGEESSQTLAITGRGTLAIFEEGVVYPYGGLGHNPFSDKRVFDFSSPELDDSAWIAPTSIKQQDDPFDPYSAAPAGWPDPGTHWIWSRGGPAPYPVGFSYFRRRFTLPQEQNLRFFISGDDGYDLRLDGAQLCEAQQASDSPSFIWGKTTSADIWCDAGDHLVAIRGENVDRPSTPSTNIASVICAVYAVSGSGQLSDGVGGPGPILRSDASSWKCLDYPATAPAPTVGAVLHLLFDEAVARGCFGMAEFGSAYLSLGFTPTLDSAGVPWPSIELGFTVGANLLTVLAELADVYVDFRMRPDTLVLDAYNTLGAATTVTLTSGVNLSSLNRDEKV